MQSQKFQKYVKREKANKFKGLILSPPWSITAVVTLYQ